LRKFFCREWRKRTNGTARGNRQPTGRPRHGRRQRGPTTRTGPGHTTATTTKTKDANKPSKIQGSRDQGQRKRVRQAEPMQQTPDCRRMRQEEGQDCEIGHATQGNTAKNDGKHKGRNISRKRINIIEHNNAHIITNNIPSIITVNITNHVKRKVTITNKENKQTRESRQKPTRHQRTHATNRTSIDSSGISFIQEYEAGREISVVVGPQDKISDNNTHGKEETRNNTALDNQLKGCVTRTRYRRHGIRNRKSADEQLITHFLWTLETAFNPASDTDAHLKKSTIIFVIGKVKSCKTKQDSNTRPRENKQGQGTQQIQKGEEERRLQKGKMVHPSTPTPRLNMLCKDSFETPLRQVLMYLWKAARDRFNERKEKKEERIKREVGRMGRNAKSFFVQPSLFTTLIIILVTFNQGTKEHTVEAYTRRAPKLQPGQVIFKRIGDTTYRLEYANIAFDLNTHLAERAVTAIKDTLERLGPRYDEDSKRREDKRHETDKTELTLVINRYRQLNTLMSPVPELLNFQTGRRVKRGLITAIAIGIMAILATSTAAAHMASSSYGSYDKVELREMEDKVNVTKSAPLNGIETIEKQFKITEKRHFTTLEALHKVQASIKRGKKSPCYYHRINFAISSAKRHVPNT
jgi:hypothetical protein